MSGSMARLGTVVDNAAAQADHTNMPGTRYKREPGPRAGCNPFATGKGWVKEHKGQYYDALHVKNGIVKICLVESQGGIAPPTKRTIFNFAKEVGSPSAVDRTDYGTASGSARGFAQHYSQQLSRAAVCGDAQNINNAARNMRVAHSFMTGLNVPPPCARAF